jgi:hypothetical protein
VPSLEPILIVSRASVGEYLMLALAVAYEVQCRLTAAVSVMPNGFNLATPASDGSKFNAQIGMSQGGGHEATGRWY